MKSWCFFKYLKLLMLTSFIGVLILLFTMAMHGLFRDVPIFKLHAPRADSDFKVVIVTWIASLIWKIDVSVPSL